MEAKISELLELDQKAEGIDFSREELNGTTSKQSQNCLQIG